MKNALSLLFLSCVVGLSFFGFYAHAQATPSHGDLKFFVDGGWETTHQHTNVDGLPRQSCTLQASFNNGFRMILSGSKDLVDALEIDFRQDLFQDGAQHKASLSIPGLRTKNFMASVASPQILRFDLSESYTLYEEARDAGVLDFKLDDNEFRFYLIGIADGAKEFETCMASSRVVSQSNRPAEPVVHKDKESKAPSAAEKSGEARPDTMPTMTLKRSNRKRLSEKLADEIKQNPDLVEPSHVSPTRGGSASSYSPGQASPSKGKRSHRDLLLPPGFDQMP